MAKKKFKTPAQMRQEAQECADMWLANLDVKRRVTEMLDAQFQTVIGSVFGLRYEFGEWRVDTRNDSDKDSPVGVYLRDKVGEAAKAWMNDVAVKLPTAFPKSVVKSLIRYYRNELEFRLEELLKEQAEKQAEKLAEQMISEVFNEEAKDETEEPEQKEPSDGEDRN